MSQHFIQVPLDILERQDLTGTAKLIFGYLQFKQGKNGKAWPGHRHIAEHCGTTRPAVARAIKHLEDKHLLKVYRTNNGRGHKYTISNETLPVPPEASGDETSPSGNETLPLLSTQTGNETLQTGNETLLQPVTKRCHKRFIKDSRKDSSTDPKALTPKPAPKKPIKKNSQVTGITVPFTLLQVPGFPEAWESYLADRKDRKISNTTRAQEMALKKLDVMNDPVAALEQSIERGYKGVFEVKTFDDKSNNTKMVEYSEEWWAEQEKSQNIIDFDKQWCLGPYSKAPAELQARHKAAKTTDEKIKIEQEYMATETYRRSIQEAARAN